MHNVLKNIPKEQIQPYFQPDKTFKIEVETFCRHITQKDKIKKIEVSKYLYKYTLHFRINYVTQILYEIGIQLFACLRTSISKGPRCTFTIL